MLNQICLKDGVGLVNIVRNAEQEEMLRKLGANTCRFLEANLHGRPDQRAGRDRRDAGIRRHRRRQARRANPDLHGDGGQQDRQDLQPLRLDVHKQVYIYGSLDMRPTELVRSFRMAWGIGGWLLFPFLQKIGPADGARLRQRVVDELKTTFASHYTKVVSLQEALQLHNIAGYGKRATGEKYLINPNKGG